MPSNNNSNDLKPTDDKPEAARTSPNGVDKDRMGVLGLAGLAGLAAVAMMPGLPPLSFKKGPKPESPEPEIPPFLPSIRKRGRQDPVEQDDDSSLDEGAERLKSSYGDEDNMGVESIDFEEMHAREAKQDADKWDMCEVAAEPVKKADANKKVVKRVRFVDDGFAVVDKKDACNQGGEVSHDEPCQLEADKAGPQGD